MRSPSIYDLRQAVERAPDEQKLAALNAYFTLLDILNTPKPGTEPTITDGVDIARLNEAVGQMVEGEYRPIDIVQAYGANPKSPIDRKKIMGEIIAGKVEHLQWTKPVRGTLVLLPRS